MGNKTIQITYFDIDERIEKTISCDPTSLCESQESIRSRNKTNHTEIVKTTEFQLIDIPNALRNHGIKHTGHAWEKAAKMQELWFSLPAREMSLLEKKGEAPVPKTNVLLDYYSLAWIEKSTKIPYLKNRVDDLFLDKIYQGFSYSPRAIYNTSARDVLQDKLNDNEFINAINILKGDAINLLDQSYILPNTNLQPDKEYRMQMFNKLFQFQLKKIFDMKDKAILISLNQLLKDECFATTGECQISVAIGKYKFFNTKLVISSVYLYVRDTFEFVNEQGSDQYLGHWNKYGFNLFYFHHFNHDKNKIEYLDNNSLCELGESPSFLLASKKECLFDTNSENRFFPVRNSTYNNWREKHQKGGDLLIFSELKEYVLNNPIIIEK